VSGRHMQNTTKTTVNTFFIRNLLVRVIKKLRMDLISEIRPENKTAAN
jgi:hypothetical protein